MDDYKTPYYKLFNRISDIIEELQDAQREAEDIFISEEREEQIPDGRTNMYSAQKRRRHRDT